MAHDNVHTGGGAEGSAQLDRIEARQKITIFLLGCILKLEVAEMADLTKITDSVARTEGADASIIALVQGLAAEVRSNATDPVALSALADRLDTQTQAIVDAVNANPITPPAPPAPGV